MSEVQVPARPEGTRNKTKAHLRITTTCVGEQLRCITESEPSCYKPTRGGEEDVGPLNPVPEDRYNQAPRLGTPRID